MNPLAQVAGYVSVVFAGLNAGGLVLLAWGVSRAEKGYSGPVFAEVRQSFNRTMDPYMPITGAGTVLGAAAALALAGERTGAQALLWAFGIAAMVVVSAISVAVNQPMNRVIDGWTKDAPPADFAALRERWGRWNAARAALGTCSFLAVLGAAVAR